MPLCRHLRGQQEPITLLLAYEYEVIILYLKGPEAKWANPQNHRFEKKRFKVYQLY